MSFLSVFGKEYAGPDGGDGGNGGHVIIQGNNHLSKCKNSNYVTSGPSN